MSVFDEWNNAVDLEQFRKDVQEAEANGGSDDYEEIPVGNYEVKVERLELAESSKGDPMVKAMFRIINGKYENKCLFMNQVFPINNPWQLGKIILPFLRSLDSDLTIEFIDFKQFKDLLMDVLEAVDGKLEYLIEYKKSKSGFANYTVKEVFEV